MTRKVIKLWPLFASIFACAAHAEPIWFGITPEQDSNYLYGSGQGISPTEAQNQALKEIAGHLHTSVSADTQSRFSLFNGQLEESHQRVIRTQVPEMPIRGYEIINTEREGNAFYQQLRIDRVTLAQGLSEELHQLNGLISRVQQHSQTPLQELVGLVKHQKALRQAQLLADSVELLHGQLPDMSAIEWGTGQLQTHLMNSSLNFDSPGASQSFRRAVSQWVNESGLALNGPSPIANLVIQVEAQSPRKLFNQFHCQVEARIQIVDQGHTIVQRQWVGNGVSSVDGFLAQQAAEHQLLAELSQQDLWSLFFQ